MHLCSDPSTPLLPEGKTFFPVPLPVACPQPSGPEKLCRSTTVADSASIDRLEVGVFNQRDDLLFFDFYFAFGGVGVGVFADRTIIFLPRPNQYSSALVRK
jgi:hypothetical protein